MSMPSGMSMMLKSMGLNADEIGKQFEQFKIAIPQWGEQIKAKTTEIESRLTSIEATQQEIFTLLKGEKNNVI